jgi:hypothetical protein
MLSSIRYRPVYLLLLPVFFVLHGYVENLGFISAGEALVLGAAYLGVTAALGFAFWLFYRDVSKAALLAFTFMAIYFFFGAVHDFFKSHTAVFFLSHYRVLFTLIFIGIVVLLYYLKKTRNSFKHFNLFLNCLFLLYIGFEAAGIASKSRKQEQNKLSIYSFTKGNGYITCDTCSAPDIYLLLMDEYTSSLALKECCNYNNDLDSFLRKESFSIQTRSRSNYNLTVFSMASMLNMSFIGGTLNTSKVDVDDYSRAERLIRNNEVIKLLSAYNYDIVNYSIFDMAGHPAIIDESLLPLNTRLITERTLFARIKKDLGWKLATWYPFKWFLAYDIMVHHKNNQKIAQLVKQHPTQKHNGSHFVYAHFYMPHVPFYYDKNGQFKQTSTVYHEYRFPTTQLYLDYLPYVNTQIKDMVTTIKRHNPAAVILLMGDHGYRYYSTPPPPVRHFQNLNAVYFPDKDYSLLYDSITCVNQFRVVFNKLFQQGLPLQQDSSVLLKERTPMSMH